MRMPTRTTAVVLGVWVWALVVAFPDGSRAASQANDLCRKLLGQGATCQTPEITLTNPQGLNATISPVTYDISASPGSSPRSTTSSTNIFNLTGASSCTFYFVTQLQCEADGTSTVKHSTSVTPKSRTGSTACGSKTVTGFYNVSQGASPDELVLSDPDKVEQPTICTLAKAGPTRPTPPASSPAKSPPPPPRGQGSGNGSQAASAAAELCFSLLGQGGTCQTPDQTIKNALGVNIKVNPVKFTISAAPGGTASSTTTGFTSIYNVTAVSSCTFMNIMKLECLSNGTAVATSTVTPTARTGTAVCASATGTGWFNVSQGRSRNVVVFSDVANKEAPTTCTMGQADPEATAPASPPPRARALPSPRPSPSPPIGQDSGTSGSGIGSSGGSGNGTSSSGTRDIGGGSSSGSGDIISSGGVGSGGNNKAFPSAAVSASGMGPFALLLAAVVCGLQLIV